MNPFPAHKRLVVVCMCALALFLAYTDRVNLSVAVIAMQPAFGWSETTKGLVMSSFFIGYLLFQVPSGWIANRYGGKRTLGVAVIWWSLFTILTPLAAGHSFALLLGARIALGLGEAAAFPATYKLFSRWVPARERSRAIAFVTAGVILGTLTALLVTGPIVSRFGWPMAFYAFGSLGLLWALGWLSWVYERPDSHPQIASEELSRLPREPGSGAPYSQKIPWATLFSRAPVWALIVNHFCVNWTLYVCLAWLPSYFSSVQSLSIMSAGIHSMAPWLTMFVIVNMASWLADYLITRGIDTGKVRKSMQAIGMIGSAVFLLFAQGAGSAASAVLLLCLALGALAFCYSGFGPNHLEIAPRHADILFGITNTVATIPGIVGIVVTGWLVDFSGSYDSAFLLAATINLIGALTWVIYSSSRPVVN